MNILNIIKKKKEGLELNKEEIEYAINEYILGNIKDYQMSSLLMAICINDMSVAETIYLTDVMIKSGDIIDLSKINGIVVDKHSTGGVGDKTTLVLAPLVAACGVNIAKMSGRGLGHTGGTIDKLESIQGYKVKLSEEEFINQVNDIGIALTSQTSQVAKADKMLYALRDVTGTVESIPLIASSIMSKKIASGADVILIDVKVGDGALVKNLEDATRLSKLMIQIGKNYSKKVICILTDMNEPLGFAIGNSLEVKEAYDTLNLQGPKDLEKLVIKLATLLISSAKNISEEQSFNLVNEIFTNKKALDKFNEWIKYQGGDINKIEISDKKIEVCSNQAGFINRIDALKLGEIAKTMKAGRMTKEDKIDYKVGIVLSKKIGDKVESGDLLATLYFDEVKPNIDEVLNSFVISNQKKEKSLILGIIND